MFMPLGHDLTPGGGQKHYRRYYPDELEDVVDPFGDHLLKSPFLTEGITRLKQVKSGGVLSGLFGGGDAPEEQVTKVGYFKGLVKCYIPKLRDERRSKMRNACF
jgi:hypothetical protein